MNEVTNPTQELAALLNAADMEYEDVEGLEVVTFGDWVDGGKYSYAQDVIKYNDEHYIVNHARSGSYFTDYYYSDSVLQRVTVETVMVPTLTTTPVGDEVTLSNGE